MTDITDPYSIVAEAVAAIIETEFAQEGFRVIHDHLHESVGYEGTRIGLSPDDETATTNRRIQLEMNLTVQFFTKWDKQIDNNQRVDPRKITNYAERFRRAVERAQATFQGSDHVWFFRIDRVTYPKDPTGNKTRFIAQIHSFGSNSGIVETTG